ncbi:hypothetical protein K2173_009846 [Erythroxylum novogranatense]|uniref:Protein YIPF n=1 Tax=Erythroxylum novogranatense TaxID=1862640 RepID=A0AAV8SZ36_9ROSI|nr:hypothetical protein K2173_009846 [Erythroxylum novogranatense]
MSTLLATQMLPLTLYSRLWYVSDSLCCFSLQALSNLKLVVFPNPYREDPGKVLRDWDLWGPFFFIVCLGLILSWSALVKKFEVFAVALALLAAGAVILTLNVLLLGGHIIFFSSLSLFGYCLFPLDIGALIYLLKDNVVLKVIVVSVNPKRKTLALYPVFFMYLSIGFLIIAID